MTVHSFPTSLPSRDQLVLPHAKVSLLASQAGGKVMEAAGKIRAADSAQEFAEAIDAMHRTLEEECRGFAALREATLKWWKPPT